MVSSTKHIFICPVRDGSKQHYSYLHDLGPRPETHILGWGSLFDLMYEHPCLVSTNHLQLTEQILPLEGNSQAVAGGAEAQCLGPGTNQERRGCFPVLKKKMHKRNRKNTLVNGLYTEQLAFGEGRGEGMRLSNRERKA